MRFVSFVLIVTLALACRESPLAVASDPAHPTMTWVKRHPRPGAERPSPRMGYECAYGYDPVSRLLVRYGGHNQGGGGEQNSEVWTYDLDLDAWDLIEPADAPPGVCCCAAERVSRRVGPVRALSSVQRESRLAVAA